VKRILVGRPQRSDRLAHSLLPKRVALPVFASDAISSTAYATQEILIVLIPTAHCRNRRPLSRPTEPLVEPPEPLSEQDRG